MKTSLSLTILITLLFSCAVGQPQAGLPETPVGKHVKAYLGAFNAPDQGQMRSFFEERTARTSLADVPVEQRLSRFSEMKERLGSLNLKRVLSSTSHSVTILATAKSGATVQLDFEFESQSPYGLLGIRVQDLGESDDDGSSAGRKANDAEVVEATHLFLDSLSNADAFSGVVLIAKRAKELFKKAYGFADRDGNVPNRTDTKFNVGSMNKRFTKTAIHQLAAQGKLSLSDPIKKFLPDYPNKEAAEKVTIQHLLSMQSGIGDFFGDRYMAAPKENIRSINDYLPLFADKQLEFEPGTANRYSNGGYVVLGAIIEKVSGTDYYSFVRENIFIPAGMSNTDSYEKDREVPNRAKGYTRDGEKQGWRTNYSTLPARGSSAGGGYSTADDLLLFINALENGTIPALDAEQGLGIAGGAPGMNSALEWEPRPGYVIAVLSNLDPPAAERVARQIRAWLPR
ncbi:MAG: serine hydrolase [Ignavibacteriales bacterium]|nr:serine hydrolase [Ignavibacteriales bacterium]